MSADLFRRDPEGRWVLYPAVADTTLELTSLGLCCPLAALYKDVTFDASAGVRLAPGDLL